MSVHIAVRLDAVQALGEELAALATELSGDVDLCRSTAVSLGTAVTGDAAEQAEATGRAWATLVADLVAGADAAAGTLLAAVDAYRQLDAAVSDRLLAARATPAAGATA